MGYLWVGGIECIEAGSKVVGFGSNELPNFLRRREIFVRTTSKTIRP
jgi:hypothetical protein